jgi:hypothetical protein
MALFGDLWFRALVTLPWLAARPPSDTAFYAVVAQIIPVLLIVFAVEFRRFEPLSQERFDRAYGFSTGFMRPFRRFMLSMLSKLPVSSSDLAVADRAAETFRHGQMTMGRSIAPRMSFIHYLVAEAIALYAVGYTTSNRLTFTFIAGALTLLCLQLIIPLTRAAGDARF